MKILEIAFHLAPGGLERFVVDLSNELSKLNDVVLLVLRDEDIDNGYGCFYKPEVSERIKFHSLGLKPGLSVSCWWKIFNFIRKINPDIVHFHGEGMPYWMIVPILFSSRKIRFVQTIHSDIHNRYDKGIYKALYMPVLGSHKLVHFVALSPTNYRELTTIYPKVSATCIVNGRAPMSPTNNYESVKMEVKALKNNENSFTYIHVGRCSTEKNQERLIMAFNKLCNEGIDANLLIIGPGFESDLGKELKSIAHKNVHFLGAKTNIADYLLCSDTFCLSSNYEGMPITLIESLLCGIPVVSTPVCGAIDAINSGQNGFIAEDFSDESYYQVLKLAYANNSELKDKTKSGIKNLIYTIHNCMSQYVDYFNKIIDFKNTRQKDYSRE